MKYIETLDWILDKSGPAGHNREEKYRENIAFVRSLGKKCDSVGWSRLQREDPQAEEILQKIKAFCKANGWTARGLYTRAYADLDTDWFALEGAYFQNDTFGEYDSAPGQDGGTVKVCSIKAYREQVGGPKRWGSDLYVPEGFYRAYREMGMTGLDFCWAKDIGKYAARQYFGVYGTRRIPRVAVAWDLKDRDLRKLGPGGGWLPRLGEVFSDWTQIDLPCCFAKEDMPAGGIAYAYIPDSFTCCGLHKILVHKEVARQLLQEKALHAGALKPVPVLAQEQLPSGYTLRETRDCPRPSEAYMAQSLLDWAALQKKARPLWQITEKEAVKLFRSAKADRKEDFEKKLSKGSAEALAATAYEPLLPYYAVANGGSLSEEYRLLPAEESAAETEAFRSALEKEALLETKPEGVVICACANGDRILLLDCGEVVRFSHEAPEITEQWPSLARFVAEAIRT